MVLNTPVSHKLNICYYNTDGNRDPSDIKCRCFLGEYSEIFKNSFIYRTPPVHTPFRNFM